MIEDLRFGQKNIDLPKNLKLVDDKLMGYGDYIILNKKQFSQSDLRLLSEVNEVEYMMLTRGSQRMIIRGDLTSVPFYGGKTAKEVEKYCVGCYQTRPGH